MLFAVPNVSEGRDTAGILGIEQAFAAPGGVKLLDTHSDPDHHRSVFWLAGGPGRLAQALVEGAKEATGWIDLTEPRGVHPPVGALDVAPIVYVRPEDRGAACAEALLAAGRLADECGLPVYLYGELGGGGTRPALRRGGPAPLPLGRARRRPPPPRAAPRRPQGAAPDPAGLRPARAGPAQGRGA